MKFEFTEDEADVIEDALISYVTDVIEDMETYNNDPENVEFYVNILKVFNSFREQLGKQRKI